MNLIDICIITIIVSFIMRIRAKLSIYKDIADLGYKFNHKKLQELNEQEDENIDIITNIIGDYYMYIPFYNLLVDAIRESNYYDNKDEIIKVLKRSGAIEKMNESEKEEYSQSKTGFHAIKMENQRIKKMSNSSLAEFPNGIKIWFDFKEDIDDSDSFTDIIEIVEVEGNHQKLSIEELKKLVYYSLIVTGDQMLKVMQEKDPKINEEMQDPAKQEKIIEKVIDIEIPLEEEVVNNTRNKTRVRKK